MGRGCLYCACKPICEKMFVMQIDPQAFVNQTLSLFKYGAMLGFLVATVLLMNLNNKAFKYVFKDRAKSYFWFFLLLSVIPLLVFIYIFNLLFGRLSLAMGAN